MPKQGKRNGPEGERGGHGRCGSLRGGGLGITLRKEVAGIEEMWPTWRYERKDEVELRADGSKVIKGLFPKLWQRRIWLEGLVCGQLLIGGRTYVQEGKR